MFQTPSPFLTKPTLLDAIQVWLAHERVAPVPMSNVRTAPFVLTDPAGEIVTVFPAATVILPIDAAAKVTVEFSVN
jgi:hypothetical protein